MKSPNESEANPEQLASILLSRRDATHTAAGCRHLADTLASDAVHQSNYRIQQVTLAKVAQLRALAVRFGEHAASAATVPGTKAPGA